MFDVRWVWTAAAEKGRAGAESLRTRREVVVGLTPKRRKDSDICHFEDS
jgi:hypothetical protein